MAAWICGLMLVGLGVPVHQASGVPDSEFDGPELTALLEQRPDFSRDEAIAFLRNQSASSDQANKLVANGLDPLSLWKDPETGTLVVNSTSEAERAVVINRVGGKVRVNKIPTSASSASLRVRLAKTEAGLPTKLPSGFHGLGIDSERSAVVANGTQEFFASALWRQLTRGLNVAEVVEPRGSVPQSAASIVPGWATTTGSSGCTAGWVTQQNTLMTAGHCTYNGGSLPALGYTVYNSAPSAIGKTASSLFKPNGSDIGKVNLYSGVGAAGTGYYSNYAGGKNRIYTVESFYQNDWVCKYGVTTRATCGSVIKSADAINIDGWYTTRLSKTTACLQKGDSGGPVALPMGSMGRAKGMSSATDQGNDTDGSCAGTQSFGWFSWLPHALEHYSGSMNTHLGTWRP